MTWTPICRAAAGIFRCCHQKFIAVASLGQEKCWLWRNIVATRVRITRLQPGFGPLVTQVPRSAVFRSNESHSEIQQGQVAVIQYSKWSLGKISTTTCLLDGWPHPGYIPMILVMNEAGDHPALPMIPSHILDPGPAADGADTGGCTRRMLQLAQNVRTKCRGTDMDTR